MMKIAFLTRKNLYEVPGGDTTQITKTMASLQKLHSVKIDLISSFNELKNNNYEIIHIFDLNNFSSTLISEIKKHKVKIVLTPIIWDLSHAKYVSFLASKLGLYPNNHKFYNSKDGFIKFLRFKDTLTFKEKSFGSFKYIKLKRDVINNIDLVLPNSEEELNFISSYYNLNSHKLKGKAEIIPNAVDIDLSSRCNNKNFLLPDSLNDYVIQVARIEPVKNQLNVVKALYNNPEFPIVFIGKFENKKFKKYYEELIKISKLRGNVYFIENVPHEDIFKYYQKAKVHVLPSYRESPGLSSLEALIKGCEIVVSSEEYCPINYYEFNKYGHICDPYDLESIKNAVIKAYTNPRNIIDKQYKYKFSYKNVADKTFNAYESLLIS